MRLDEKIMVSRKQRGMSQEQLADYLNVTRQSVSKWESGLAVPELAKIISMSELFDVSVDYLVKEELEEDILHHLKESTIPENSMQNNAELETMVGEIRNYMKGYQFTSKTKIFGIPLVSVRLSPRRMGKDCVAKGIIAIGNVSVGVVSIGLVSTGVISIGCLGLGGLAIGAASVGLVSLGALSLGVLAFGSAAVGVYAGGVAVYGSQIAVGVAVKGHTAIGESVHGVNQLQYYKGIPADTIRDFLLQHEPNLWGPVREFFVALGTSIK